MKKTWSVVLKVIIAVEGVIAGVLSEYRLHHCKQYSVNKVIG